MKYFNEILEIEELRKQFRQFCLELHPDKGGDHQEFVAMKAEYDKVLSRAAAIEAGTANRENRKAKFSYASESGLAETIERLMRVEGIIIELCGSWLWVTGETWLVTDQLKALGLKYSGSKKSWYYSPYMSGCRRARHKDLDTIRDTYGSETIKGVKTNLIAA